MYNNNYNNQQHQPQNYNNNNNNNYQDPNNNNGYYAQQNQNQNQSETTTTSTNNNINNNNSAADSNNPLNLDQVPNLRWTFTICPNGNSAATANNNSNNNNAQTDSNNNAGGVGSKLSSVGAAAFRAITGAGSSGNNNTTSSGSNNNNVKLEDESSAAYNAHQLPPPLASETVIPLACMYSPMHDHVTSVADDDAGRVYGTLPRIIGPLGQQPPQCKTCKTYLARHIPIDATTKVWGCPCCLTRNSLPPNLFETWMCNGQGDDIENHPVFQYPTVEYVLRGSTNQIQLGAQYQQQQSKMTPVFLFIVDICIDPDELEALKKQLIRSLDWLPSDARVGVMTFGHGITLWELGCSEVNRCYAFRGNRRYTANELGRMLGLPTHTGTSSPTTTSNAAAAATSGGGAKQTTTLENNSSFAGGVTERFLCPLSDCELALNHIVEDIRVDSFPVAHDQRPLRATGAALEIATTLIELVAESHFGKILLFCGGPCTRGPGAVVSPLRKILMRGHKDLGEGNAPLYDDAVKFYRELEVRMTKSTSSLDCFAYSLDQVGLLEIRSCINNTGGMLVMGDKFKNNMFGPSLQRYFERGAFGQKSNGDAQTKNNNNNNNNNASDPSEDSSDPQLADPNYYNGSVIWTRGKCSGFGLDISVNTSPETKIMGALGHCRSGTTVQMMANKNASNIHNNLNNISAHRVGVSGTNRWLTSCADSSLTLGFVFDTDSTPVSASGRKRFIQIVTKYYATNGELRARVTSVAMPILTTTGRDTAQVIQQYNAFDQECAAVIVARMAVSLMEHSDNSRFETIRRWIDTLLVKFCRKFGSYVAGAVDSLRIPQGFSLFPAFMFNFRRSEYFMILNISPDDTTFKRHYLMRETCDNCTIMVQPVLYSYSMEHPFATPMPLDVASIHADNILLLDAFFNVHIMYGVSIEEWINAGYQDQPDFAHFKELLDLPQRDADLILSSRMPYPWFSTTGRFGGDARHFLNRFSSGGGGASGGSGNNIRGAAASGGGAGQTKSGDGATLFTEDASIQKFMHSLKTAVVQPEK